MNLPPARRPPDASAVDRLLAEPQRFEFHQAVRLLQGWLRRLPAQERPVVRFRNTLSLSFPPSEIASLEARPPMPADRPATGPGDA
ncbi:MAG TPA: type VI secretion system baseplate subunit TssG, partial [Burkholderiaceae bacterium]